MITHAAVCGAGAFGRNHIRIYRELALSGAPVRLSAIVDPDPACLATLTAAGVSVYREPEADAVSPSTPDITHAPREAAAPDAIPVFPSVAALFAAVTRGALRIDAASVCVPTSAHHAVAAELLAAGIHVLVEKPITATLSEADDLLRLAREHRRTLMVGHLERFNPAVQALAPLLRGPMFFEAHRLSVFSPRSLDVDVILDLMIHDLDIVLALTRSPVTSVHAVGLPILSRKTDIANVRVEFASGCVANFTASRVSTERVRKLRFFQPHQYISVDYARQDLLVIEVQPPAAPPTRPVTAASASSVTLAGAASPLSSVAPSLPRHPERSEGPAFPTRAIDTQAAEISLSPPALPTLGMHKPPVTPGEPLRLEIEAFLHTIQSGDRPHVTPEQARAALALALQIQQAIETHAHHAGLQAFTR